MKIIIILDLGTKLNKIQDFKKLVKNENFTCHRHEMGCYTYKVFEIDKLR